MSGGRAFQGEGTVTAKVSEASLLGRKHKEPHVAAVGACTARRVEYVGSL